MVRVARRRVGTRTYHYLQHTFRRGGRVEKREVYLGSRVPKNVEEMMRRLLADVDRERYLPLLEQIRRGHARERSRTPPSAAEREAEAFAVRFTYDTQRIEGSTLTLRETADLLQRGTTPSGRPLRDVKEAEAHRNLLRDVLQTKGDLSRPRVLEWHWRLFRETKPDIAGLVRRTPIRIAGSRFVPSSPVEVEPLLREFHRWYDRSRGRLHPVELAARLHMKFVTLHPFHDGNGRISRLMMNFVLHRNGFPMLNIPCERRTSYYNALERAQVTGREEVFVQWVLRRYVKEHRRFIEGAKPSTGRQRPSGGGRRRWRSESGPKVSGRGSSRWRGR